MEIESCELCKLVNGNIKTKFYYSDDVCIIVDCETYGIPMVVLNHHGKADGLESRLMKAVVDALFEYDHIRITPRKIKDHEHWYITGAALKNTGRKYIKEYNTFCNS